MPKVSSGHKGQHMKMLNKHSLRVIWYVEFNLDILFFQLIQVKVKVRTRTRQGKVKSGNFARSGYIGYLLEIRPNTFNDIRGQNIPSTPQKGVYMETPNEARVGRR